MEEVGNLRERRERSLRKQWDIQGRGEKFKEAMGKLEAEGGKMSQKGNKGGRVV